MNGPASEASLAGIAPNIHPEGADRSSFSPSPSRIRYERTRLGGPSRRHCPGTPSGRCRPKQPFTVTFSHSLRADPPRRPFSPALPRIPVRKVPAEAAFLRHLLEFVMNGPASEALLAGIAPNTRPEGADRSSFSPSPSRIRYEQTRLGGHSRRHCPGYPSGRCQPKQLFTVTFSHSFGEIAPKRQDLNAGCE